MATIFFDYDGTLHDTMLLYGPAFRKGYDSLVRAGWAKPRQFDDEWIARWLGWTIPDMWAAFMPNLPDAVWRGASHEIGAEMDRLLEAGAAGLYAGIPEALDALCAAGYDLAILSNSARKYRDTHRAHFNLDQWFSAYHVAEDYPGLAKWEYLRLALAEHSAPYVLVGDRFHDIEAAVRNNIPSVGCLWGCGERSELDQATVRLAKPEEIPAAIKNLLS